MSKSLDAHNKVWVFRESCTSHYYLQNKKWNKWNGKEKPKQYQGWDHKLIEKFPSRWAKSRFNKSIHTLQL